MPSVVREMCSLVWSREVTTLPTGCHGPGFEGGTRLALEGTNEIAATAASSPFAGIGGESSPHLLRCGRRRACLFARQPVGFVMRSFGPDWSGK